MITKSQAKYIQSLNEKKFRTEAGVFVAEGPKIINELLAGNQVEPVELYATPAWWLRNEQLKNTLPFVLFHELSEKELVRVSFLAAPNQVLGIFKQPGLKDLFFQHRVSLMLEGIQDPGNLGTIVRIADWFGIRQIVASPDSADVFNPKVVQATMGSIGRVKILYQDLMSFLDEHKNIPLFATTLNGLPLAESGKIKEGLLLIGNESKGISKELVGRSGKQLTIQKFGYAESLNAAVATGIILSHIM